MLLLLLVHLVNTKFVSLYLSVSLNLPLISFYLFHHVRNVYYCCRQDHDIDEELKAVASNIWY